MFLIMLLSSRYPVVYRFDIAFSLCNSDVFEDMRTIMNTFGRSMSAKEITSFSRWSLQVLLSHI